ncbi:MAG TPA: hypothetical protein VLK88_11930, partial [Gemmatimonadales bacterium]|nr:hypothetical protein [Gemmatimonadales bacterium]
MLPISRSVEDVIPGIDRAGEETEGDERQPGTQVGSEVKKFSGEEQRGENKSVLDPLLRPNESNPIAEAGVDRRSFAHWHSDPGMNCVSGATGDPRSPQQGKYHMNVAYKPYRYRAGQLAVLL